MMSVDEVLAHAEATIRRLRDDHDVWMTWLVVDRDAAGASVRPSELSCLDAARALWCTGGVDRIRLECGDYVWKWSR